MKAQFSTLTCSWSLCVCVCICALCVLANRCNTATMWSLLPPEIKLLYTGFVQNLTDGTRCSEDASFNLCLFPWKQQNPKIKSSPSTTSVFVLVCDIGPRQENVHHYSVIKLVSFLQFKLLYPFFPLNVQL